MLCKFPERRRPNNLRGGGDLGKEQQAVSIIYLRKNNESFPCTELFYLDNIKIIRERKIFFNFTMKYFYEDFSEMI